jgi:hypothetical protein
MRKEERMGRGWVAGFSTFLLLVGFCGGSTPGYAGMDVSVNIGIPAVVVAQPPEMVLVPDSQIYYAPSVEAELFFYRGNWYTRHGRRWYRGRSYNGPWVVAAPRTVPGAFVRLPGNYRTVHVRGERVPYGQLNKHWKHREEERRWERRGGHPSKEHRHGRDHHGDRDDHRGR